MTDNFISQRLFRKLQPILCTIFPLLPHPLSKRHLPGESIERYVSHLMPKL